MFILLVALLAIFGIWQAFGTKPGMETYVMASMHRSKVSNDDIDGVVIQRTRPKEEKLVFVRGSDKQWRLTEPFEDRVDKSALENTIRQVVDARKEERTDVDSNLKKWGLDNPSAVVTLQQGTEKKWTLNLGNESLGGDMSSDVYVSAGDKPSEPAAVKRSELAGLFKNINEFRQKSLLAENLYDITAVRLQEPKHDPVSLDKTSEGRWRFEKPAYGEADFEGEGTPSFSPQTTNTNITGVRDLLQAVVDTRVESDADFAETNAKDADLAAKGLAENNPERMRLEVKSQSSIGSDAGKDSTTHVLLIGKKADDKGDKLYARLSDSRNIVKVPAKYVDKIAKVIENPAALRNRELVQIDAAKTNTIDAINVEMPGRELLKLRRVSEGSTAALAATGNWKIFEAGKAQEADTSAVQGLINALTAKRLVKDFPEAGKSDADLGLDKPAAVVSLWVDGIKKEEPKDEKKDDKSKEEGKDGKKDAKDNEAKKDQKDAKGLDAKAAEAKKEEKKDPNAEPALKDQKPNVKLAFGKREKDVVYVRREAGGEVIRLAVPVNVLDKAEEGKLAYLIRKLPSYGFSNEVTKVVLTRGGETFELDRPKDEKQTPPWKLKLPVEFAGRTADSFKVEHILNELRDLQAEKLVSEKATPNDMDRFGLAMPQEKVTLTLTKSDKKTEDHVYLFGKETDDKSGVYAKQGNSDLIFVVRKAVVDSLRGDLLDPTVFTFDAGKVRGLKLSGWQDIVGSPFTLDLERKAGQSWSIKSPPDFKLDTNKVDAFVAGLTNLRALRFLPPKSQPKPEYKLDLKDGALDVVLVVEGESQPIALTIGGAAGTDGFYGRSNKVPADIFILPKAAFEQPKGKPAYFKKEQ
jgi:hypothetical protein